MSSNVDEKAKETSKKIKILIQERKLNEAIKLTEKYPNDHVIQSQRISIAFMQKDLETARKIAERKGFKNKRAIYSQRIKLALMEEKLEEAEKLINEAYDRPNFVDIRLLNSYKSSLEKKQKNQKQRIEAKKQKKKQYLEYAKVFMVKLYNNDIVPSDIQEIEESKLLSSYHKTCMLLAICDKTKNRSGAQNVYKKYKTTNPEQEELKKVNRLMQRIQSKNPRIFDYGFYEVMLGLKPAPIEQKGRVEPKNEFEASLMVDQIDYSIAIQASLSNNNSFVQDKINPEQK